MAKVNVIPLECWQDPQGDVLLVYSERECSVYFGCWTEAGEPASYIALLQFEHAEAARSYRREFIPYQLPEHEYHSYILQIEDSEFYQEHLAYRSRHYPRQVTVFEMKHFVVIGHDSYHEILAVGVTESKVMEAQLTDPRIRELFHAT